MLLSKLVLDPQSHLARRDLANPYQMHASLCRAFAAPDERPPRFLWRLEAARNTRFPHVLVQSAAAPNWEGFGAYFCAPPEVGRLPLGHLQEGQPLRFRLRANPTVTRYDPEAIRQRQDGTVNQGKGKRHGLTTVEEQLSWLARQGERGGFTVLGTMVASSERVRMTKHKGGPPITVQAVLFEGHLRIADLEAFKATLQGGVGPAKALGFGLLSVAKA